MHQRSRIDHKLTRPPLQIPNEWITAPEDAMQIDSMPELPPSGGYEIIVTGMNLFSRYIFNHPTSNQNARTIAKVINKTIIRRAYLPATLTSNKRSSFESQVIEEVARVLGITLKHATTKHAQTVGMFERSDVSIKQALKIETGERISLWHKYVSIVVLHYNTSCHASIGCEPSWVFHGLNLSNARDRKLGIRLQQAPNPTSQIAQDVRAQTETIYQDFRKNGMQALIKFKAYYVKKAIASKLKQANFIYVSQLKANHQGSETPFTEFRWIGPYSIEEVLPSNKYLVVKVRTDETQVLLVCDYGNSYPDKPKLTYKSRHKNGNTWYGRDH